MQRVLIIGPCGAGKSTLASVLGPKLGLPVFHMDQLNWQPGWVESSKDEIRQKLAAITATDRWLICLSVVVLTAPLHAPPRCQSQGNAL